MSAVPSLLTLIRMQSCAKLWRRHSRWHCSSIFIAVLVLASGCHTSVSGFNESSDTKAIVEGNEAFAINIYHQLDEQKGNFAFSPLSTYAGLAITYVGARAETKDEMAKVLHFTLPQQSIPPAFDELFDWLAKV